MGLLSKLFYKTGKSSATRPWTSIFIGLVIVAVGSIGFINSQTTVSSWAAGARAENCLSAECRHFGRIVRLDC